MSVSCRRSGFGIPRLPISATFISESHRSRTSGLRFLPCLDDPPTAQEVAAYRARGGRRSEERSRRITYARAAVACESGGEVQEVAGGLVDAEEVAVLQRVAADLGRHCAGAPPGQVEAAGAQPTAGRLRSTSQPRPRSRKQSRRPPGRSAAGESKISPSTDRDVVQRLRREEECGARRAGRPARAWKTVPRSRLAAMPAVQSAAKPEVRRMPQASSSPEGRTSRPGDGAQPRSRLGCALQQPGRQVGRGKGRASALRLRTKGSCRVRPEAQRSCRSANPRFSPSSHGLRMWLPGGACCLGDLLEAAIPGWRCPPPRSPEAGDPGAPRDFQADRAGPGRRVVGDDADGDLHRHPLRAPDSTPINSRNASALDAARRGRYKREAGKPGG